MSSAQPGAYSGSSNVARPWPPRCVFEERRGFSDDGIDLYVAILHPDCGNYWQWALVAHHWREDRWECFNVVQDSGNAGNVFRKSDTDLSQPRCKRSYCVAHVEKPQWDQLLGTVDALMQGSTPWPEEVQNWSEENPLRSNSVRFLKSVAILWNNVHSFPTEIGAVVSWLSRYQEKELCDIGIPV